MSKVPVKAVPVEMDYDLTPDETPFQAQIKSDYPVKSFEFWEEDVVKSIGEISIRPGNDDYTGEIMFYFKRENTKFKNTPSIVELNHVHAFMNWATERLIEVEEIKFPEMIAILKKNPTLASPTRHAGSGWPKEFFDDDKITLKLGGFRVRPYYCPSRRVNLFYMNSERNSEQHKSWAGPCVEVKIGELKRIQALLFWFMKQF